MVGAGTDLLRFLVVVAAMVIAMVLVVFVVLVCFVRAVLVATVLVLGIVVLFVFHVFFSFFDKRRKNSSVYAKSVIAVPLQRANANPRSLVPLYTKDKRSKLPYQRAYIRTHYKSKA